MRHEATGRPVQIWGGSGQQSRAVHTVHVYWCAIAPTRYHCCSAHPVEALHTFSNLDQNKKNYVGRVTPERPVPGHELAGAAAGRTEVSADVVAAIVAVLAATRCRRQVSSPGRRSARSNRGVRSVYKEALVRKEPPTRRKTTDKKRKAATKKRVNIASYDFLYKPLVSL